MIRSVLAVAAVAALAAGTAGCGDNGKEQAKANASQSCPADIGGSPQTPLPSDVPQLPGEHVYSSASQGATKVWFGAVDGSPDTLTQIRDQVTKALKGNGYTIKGTDQEAGAEAEAEFAGAHDGTLQVIPLCSGKVRLRYKLES